MALLGTAELVPGAAAAELVPGAAAAEMVPGAAAAELVPGEADAGRQSPRVLRPGRRPEQRGIRMVFGTASVGTFVVT